MDSGGRRGGSLKVLEFIQDHPAELAYDFRSKFQLSIYDVGSTVTLKEAVLLISMLLRQTDSWLTAALSEWDYPVSREWIVGAHTYDLHAAVNSSKTPKPYPTPWKADGVNRIGKAAPKSDVLARLDKMNPKEQHGN